MFYQKEIGGKKNWRKKTGGSEELKIWQLKISNWRHKALETCTLLIEENYSLHPQTLTANTTNEHTMAWRQNHYFSLRWFNSCMLGAIRTHLKQCCKNISLASVRSHDAISFIIYYPKFNSFKMAFITVLKEHFIGSNAFDVYIASRCRKGEI